MALAAQALAALTGGAPVTSVTLTGDATWTAGADTDTGTVTLEAAAGGLSRVDLELAGGSRLRVRAPLNSRPGAPPAGAETATGTLARSKAEAGGATRRIPLGALWTPAAWFFPALALGQPGVAQVQFTDLGPASVDGAPADRLRAVLDLANQSPATAGEIATLSQADYDLDPATHLPEALDFKTHPTGVVNRGAVRIEIRYGDWRQVSGVEVPYRIERWVNGTRQLLITLTSAEINPSLPASDFQLGGAQ